MSNALADIVIPRTSNDEETAFRLRDYFSGLLGILRTLTTRRGQLVDIR